MIAAASSPMVDNRMLRANSACERLKASSVQRRSVTSIIVPNLRILWSQFDVPN
jgi:hypothetical protein